jgi:two-component system chemotaxis response regulator CheB
MDLSPASSPRLIVIAASAGGLTAIIEVLAPLPADFPAAIALVQHRGPDDPEMLVNILASRTRLRVCHAQDGTVLQPGTVYVCPPRMHMTAEHAIRLVDGPRVDFVQPSADLMFESVARSYGDRALGIVLSGCGHDAAVGSVAIAQAGGVVIAQDARTCKFSSMPEAAIRTGAVAQLLTPAEMAATMHRWVDGQGPLHRPVTDVARETRVLIADDHRIVLEGLAALVDSEPGMTVVARVDDGFSAIRAALDLAPEVVVMDIRMPGVNGIEATRQILAGAPSTRIVALSSESDPATVDAMLGAGASGYLTKHRAFGELAQAIRSVMRGDTYLSQEIARLVAKQRVQAPGQRPATSGGSLEDVEPR